MAARPTLGSGAQPAVISMTSTVVQDRSPMVDDVEGAGQPSNEDKT
jgi:hypothetical protein